LRLIHPAFELSFLQQLDVFLASRLVSTPMHVPEVHALTEGVGIPRVPEVDPREWISAVLGLRGLLVHPEDVDAVRRGRVGRYSESQHEHAMIRGLCAVFRVMHKRAARGRPPEGWHLAELFKMFTKGVVRFRRNSLRRDMPWDAILYVNYPEASRVRVLLDGFNLDMCYGDNPIRFQSLHPVRQAFRLLWRLARIAPFPDFNLVMAFVAMSEYLLYKGYPLFCPEPEDRVLLHRLLSGGAPNRVMRFESRLLGRVKQAI
jgi:hypothetical protein